MLQLGWSGRVDPDANITNFVGTGGSQNVAGYSNPAIDKLLDQARQLPVGGRARQRSTARCSSCCRRTTR